jgi:hypothetical protein
LADPRTRPEPGRGVLTIARRAGRRRLGIGIAAIVVVAFSVLSAKLFIWPPTSYPARADVILDLNGNDSASRLDLALRLLEQGKAPVMLYSMGTGQYCPQRPGLTIVCFAPHPARTVGEIDFASEYVRAHGLRSALIVAGAAQTTRARLIADRCFAGHAQVMPASMPWNQVPGQLVYQWGAMIKALALGCH